MTLDLLEGVGVIAPPLPQLHFCLWPLILNSIFFKKMVKALSLNKPCLHDYETLHAILKFISYTTVSQFTTILYIRLAQFQNIFHTILKYNLFKLKIWFFQLQIEISRYLKKTSWKQVQNLAYIQLTQTRPKLKFF